MTYANAINELHSNHFNPSPIIEHSTNGENKIIGLAVYSPPILKEDKIKRLQEILGQEFNVQWSGKDDNIHITIK